MAASTMYAFFCCVFISLGQELMLVYARPQYPLMVPRGQRKSMVGDHMYFIGKRNSNNNEESISRRDTLADRLRLTEEKISDSFLQNQCFSDNQCPETHCCALYQAEPRRDWSIGSFRHPMAQCVPLGYNGDMCFYNQPDTLGAGCGCARGLRCVTFAGYGFGVCVEDK